MSRRSGAWLLAVVVVLVALGLVSASAQEPSETPRLPGLPRPSQAPLRIVAPSIQITSPPADATFHQENVRLVAATTSLAGVANVAVTVNGRAVPTPLNALERGSRHVTIEATLELAPGDNVINIAVTDAVGGRSTVSRRVKRSLLTASGDIAELHAVVIGVRSYRHAAVPTRRFAENDARAVADALVRGGLKAANMRVLHDGSGDAPTLGRVNDALGDWLYDRVGARDSVVIYFAGHGAKDDERAYLLPRDADPGVPESTALDLERLESLVRRLRARQVLIVVDAPFARMSGGFAGATTVQQAMTLITRRAGRAVIAASGGNEEALELASLKHGLLTHYVVRGLDGDADADRDGVITGPELFAHVERHVEEHASNLGARQRPVMYGNLADLPVLARRK
ncbi:MAG: caspase family protein [Candidatus Rokubacteria bacterium]|nr:caspase family protein [Candidatus Rokubacteria bacterium]